MGGAESCVRKKSSAQRPPHRLTDDDDIEDGREHCDTEHDITSNGGTGKLLQTGSHFFADDESAVATIGDEDPE